MSDVKIKVKNLKAITNMEVFPIKKLNILLGKNSVGKSTLARLFPLIQQSVSKDRNSPIEWFTQASVDFGNFERALFHGEDNNKTIEISVTKNLDNILNLISNLWDIKYQSNWSLNEIQNLSNDTVYTIKLYLTEDMYSNIEIDIFDYHIEINNFKKQNNIVTKISINGFDINKDLYSTSPNYKESTIFENINIKTSNVEDIFNKMSEKLIPYIRKLTPRIHKKTLVKKICGELYIMSPEKRNAKIIDNLKSLSPSVEKHINNCNKDDIDEVVNQLSILNGIIICLPLIITINSDLANFFGDSVYISPIRSEATRYYRKQSDLTLLPNGSNIGDILSTLSSSQKNSWKKWTQDLFNITFDVKWTGKNQDLEEIIVRESDFDKGINLVDTGSGYTQILPILYTLWDLSYKEQNKKRNSLSIGNKKKTVIIEQPELHLHPAFQQKFADAVIYFSKQTKNINLIIETHSKIIVDRLGQQIYNDIISQDDISILLFEQIEQTNGTTITNTFFDDFGNLENFPLGFI